MRLKATHAVISSLKGLAVLSSSGSRHFEGKKGLFGGGWPQCDVTELSSTFAIPKEN